MFAAKNYPEDLRPEHLDVYLANGWYRMGQSVFTTNFLCFGEEFYSALWIRLPLENYQFSKSLSKLLRKNQERFRCEFRPARLDEEKEHLYRVYRENFSGMLAPSLRDSLLDGEDCSIFETLEFVVYDHDLLVAASFFDLGADSISSIQGIYHPDYKPYSLGFFTMLMEMVYAQKNNYMYFYPGYVVPGYTRFDYKLRIGEVEYLELRSNEWLPYKSLKRENIPIVKMKDRLQLLSAHLKESGIPHKWHYYPLFESNLFGFWRIPLFDYPMMIYIRGNKEGKAHYVVIFDPRTNQYQFLFCTQFDEIQFFFSDAFAPDFQDDQFFMDLLLIDQVLESSADAETIALALTRMVAGD